MKFSIPWAAPGLNEWKRTHWRKNKAISDTVATYIVMAIGRPGNPVNTKAIVTVKIFRPGRRYDNDGCVIARKYILDSLRRLEWLKNDSPVWCQSSDLPCELAPEPRVEVTIEYEALPARWRHLKKEVRA